MLCLSDGRWWSSLLSFRRQTVRTTWTVTGSLAAHGTSSTGWRPGVHTVFVSELHYSQWGATSAASRLFFLLVASVITFTVFLSPTSSSLCCPDVSKLRRIRVHHTATAVMETRRSSFLPEQTLCGRQSTQCEHTYVNIQHTYMFIWTHDWRDEETQLLPWDLTNFN